MYEYKAKVIRIVDGDTIELLIDLGFGVSKVEMTRLANIDAYEKSLRNGQTAEEKALGIEATNYLIDLLSNKDVIVKTVKDSGKYGRYIANIFYNDESISDLMVKLGYAHYKEY